MYLTQYNVEKRTSRSTSIDRMEIATVTFTRDSNIPGRYKALFPSGVEDYKIDSVELSAIFCRLYYKYQVLQPATLRQIQNMCAIRKAYGTNLLKEKP